MFKLDSSHTLLEMANVGKFDIYTCSFYGEEGPVPHFHFYNVSKNIFGCIRLDKPNYFIHGKHKAKLNSKGKKQLIEWLNSKETPFKKFMDKLTVWEYICILWNENNPDNIYNNDKIPNYENLPLKE